MINMFIYNVFILLQGGEGGPFVDLPTDLCAKGGNSSLYRIQFLFFYVPVVHPSILVFVLPSTGCLIIFNVCLHISFSAFSKFVFLTLPVIMVANVYRAV